MQIQLRNNSGIFPAIMRFLAAILFSVAASAGGEEGEPAAEDHRAESIDASATHRARIDEHFTAQDVDAEWAPTVERNFQENVRSAVDADRESPLATVEIRSFVCRSATCKIEATLSGPGDFRLLMAALNEHIPWDHTAEWFLVSTDPAVLVGYISRENAAMPSDNREPSMH